LPLQRCKVDVWPNGTTLVCEGVEIGNPPSSEAFVIHVKLIIDGQVVSRDVDWPQPFKYLDLGRDAGLRGKNKWMPAEDGDLGGEADEGFDVQ
jgi:beta-mannosidase